jgi:hypothetical protein
MLGINGEGPYYQPPYKKHENEIIPWWVAIGLVIGIILFAMT